MHTYIDSNIFLDFFHLTSTDLEELRKLEVLIKNHTVTLYLPQQTIDEIQRNRDSKITDALTRFEKDTDAFKVSFPAFTKDMPEHGQLKELLNQANRKHSDLVRKARDSVNSSQLVADNLIQDLQKVAKVIQTSDAVFGKAISRFRMGNPPGKGKSSIGDEINWEILLSSVPDNEDLYLISGDRDYKSSLDGTKVNSFLKAEWERKKNGQLRFYESLSRFFNEKFPHIKVASDVENELLIQKLAQSKSFAATHLLIGKLQNQTLFNTEHVEQLIMIGEQNTQVFWIIEDNDLREFYSRLEQNYGNKISEPSRQVLTRLLTPSSNQDAALNESDTFPF
ncbi:MAG: PIN domain-containing protein [Betaproteobacteria bacterium]